MSKVVCDCGDHTSAKNIQHITINKVPLNNTIPSFHTIIKKIDKIFRTGGDIILISKL